MKHKDIQFEFFRGKGPGGQHKNKTSSCVRATHLPTGTVVTIDGRHQSRNKKQAVKEIERRLLAEKASVRAEQKKLRRDTAIREMRVIRTYDLKAMVVRDHRSGVAAPLAKVLYKGEIERLWPRCINDKL